LFAIPERVYRSEICLGFLSASTKSIARGVVNREAVSGYRLRAT
jgi:hypothetical protein